MAEFCEACAAEIGNPYGDFRDMAAEGEVTLVLCEGCGPIYVDPKGNCVSKNCFKAGQAGHGKKGWEERQRKTEEILGITNNGPKYEDGPWAEGWEDRNKGDD